MGGGSKNLLIWSNCFFLLTCRVVVEYIEVERTKEKASNVRSHDGVYGADEDTVIYPIETAKKDVVVGFGLFPLVFFPTENDNPQ